MGVTVSWRLRQRVRGMDIGGGDVGGMSMEENVGVHAGTRKWQLGSARLAGELGRSSKVIKCRIQ